MNARARRLKRARRAWSRSRGCRCSSRSRASAPSSRAAARPRPGRPSCLPPRAQLSMSTRPSRARRCSSSPRTAERSPSTAATGRRGRSRRRRAGGRRVRGRRRKPPHLPRLRARAGVPVNVIDKPAFCDFSFGAIVNRSPLVIGISTDGAAPVFGQAIRAKLEALIPRGFARWAEAARAWRPRVQALALSFRERRRFWERFTARAVAEPERAPASSRHRRLMAGARGVRANSRLGRRWSAPAPAIPNCSRCARCARCNPPT